MKISTKSFLLYGFIVVTILVALFSFYSTADAACGQSCAGEKSWWYWLGGTWYWSGYTGTGATCTSTQEPTWGNWTNWGWWDGVYWGYYTCSCQTNQACVPQTPPPTLSFSASPTSITQGSSSALSWSTTNATSCSASGTWSGAKATSGSQSVSPPNTSTYTLSCSGGGGTAIQSATVTVIAACVANQGQSCNVNACGTAGGTYNCNGTCSGSTPATPYTVGAACNRNVCGGTGTITNQCTGACSASAPTVYTVGAACTSSPNACGATNGTISDQCTGACSPPSNPPSCSRCNNVGECNSGYECSGPGTCSVSAPADRATSCRGGAGGSLSSGVNAGSFPEYYGINNAWNNVTCGPSSTYSCPAGSTTKVYLSYGTETNYDFVKIYNGAGSSLEQFSGNSGYTWKGPYAASSLKFGFTSDGSIPGSNFDIWKVECVVPADTTAPNNVTNLSSSSHTTSTWSKDSTVDVSWTAATDNTGGSGLDGYSIIWDITSNTLPDTTKDIEETITTRTSPSLTNGNSHYFHIRSVDNAGIWATGAAHLGPLYIDVTVPNTPTIQNPEANSVQSSNFWVQTSGDGDAGGSGNTCYYAVWDSGVGGWTVNTTTRTCTTTTANSFQVTVGPGLNCRTPGGTCTVYAFAQDGAGNNSSQTTRSFLIEPTLTFPTGTWQRLWYATSGASPSFVTSNFLGEGPNESVEKFTTDWIGGSLAYGRSDDIGFKSSRTIDFTNSPGNYRFTVGADDGFRLYIDGVEKISEWNNNNYDAHVRTVDVSLSAGNHTFQLDYYENTGNAKVSFGYTLVPCEGNVSLSFNPPTTIKNGSVQPVASGISNCQNKQVFFKDSSLNQVSSCFVGSGGAGCPGSSFNAPSSQGDYSYYVYVDINGDGNYMDGIFPDPGESTSAILGVIYGLSYPSWSTCVSECGLGSLAVLGGYGCRDAGYLTGYCYDTGGGCFCTAKDGPSNYQVCGLPGADAGFFKPISDSYTTGGRQFSLSPYAKDISDLYVSGDNGQVRYWYHKTGTDANGYQYQYDRVDDKVSGQCYSGGLFCGSADLEMRNTWRFASPDKLTISTLVEKRCASHDLNVGFEFNSGNKYSIANAGSCLTGERDVVVMGPTDAQKTGVPKETVINFEYCGDGEVSLSCGEQCEPSTAGCLSSCTWETTPPTSKIKKVEAWDDLNATWKEPGFRPNFPTAGAYTAFLNAENAGNTKKTWWVQVEDADNVGGSGLNTCHILINGVEKPTRSCNGWATFTVGKPATGADCTVEKAAPSESQCIVKVWATDNAGNTNAAVNRIIGDINPDLTLEFEKDQRNYKNFILHSQGFNVFNFGVDYTPPTAQ